MDQSPSYVSPLANEILPVSTFLPNLYVTTATSYCSPLSVLYEYGASSPWNPTIHEAPFGPTPFFVVAAAAAIAGPGRGRHGRRVRHKP